MKYITSREVIGMFFERLAMDNGMSWIDRVAMKFTSDQDTEKYPWIGMVPQMREWIGGRHAKTLPEEVITIENLHFEATLEFLKKELRRDKTGQVMIRINELADRTNSHWSKLLSALINNGHTDALGLAYDGQYFFDTDHVTHESGTQSNDLAIDISAIPVTNHGTPSAPSVGEMADVIMTSIEQIIGFKDDQGEPMNELVRSFDVMVPVSLYKRGLAALGNQMIDAGESNTVVAVRAEGFDINLVGNPRLTANDTIFTFANSGTTTALIRQEETEVELKAKGDGSEYEFDNDAHQYGVDTWRNVGYGRWEKACRAQMV